MPLGVSCRPAPRPERAWLGGGAASADQGQGLPGLPSGWTPSWTVKQPLQYTVGTTPTQGPTTPCRDKRPPASSAAQRLPCPHPSPAHLSSEQPQHPGRADAGWGLTALGSPRLSLPICPSCPCTCGVSLTHKAHLPPALPSSRAVAAVTPVTGSNWFPACTQPRLQFRAGGDRVPGENLATRQLLTAVVSAAILAGAVGAAESLCVSPPSHLVPRAHLPARKPGRGGAPQRGHGRARRPGWLSSPAPAVEEPGAARAGAECGKQGQLGRARAVQGRGWEVPLAVDPLPGQPPASTGEPRAHGGPPSSAHGWAGPYGPRPPDKGPAARAGPGPPCLSGSQGPAGAGGGVHTGASGARCGGVTSPSAQWID